MGPQHVAEQGGGVGHDPVNPQGDETAHVRWVVDGPGVDGQPMRVGTPQVSGRDEASGDLQPIRACTDALGKSRGSGPLEEDLARASGRLDGRRSPAPCCAESARRKRGQAHSVPGGSASEAIECRSDHRRFLQVDVDRCVRVGFEEFLQSKRGFTVGKAGAAYVLPRPREHRPGHVGGSVQQWIVVDDGNAVARGSDIGLEPRVAQADGRGESSGGVLRGEL